MRQTILSALSAVVLVVGASSAALSADRYTIDPVHTSIGFAVRHFVINKVRGPFRIFSGTLIYDKDDITKLSVSATIKPASIDTRHAERAEDLRSPDFLEGRWLRSSRHPHNARGLTRDRSSV